ncbi:MAG: response regulator [Candidatus Omnitrophota bacterium]
MVKLLLVDDEKGITDTLKGFFQYRGYTVDTANRGEDAMNLVRSNKPRIVFLDIKMPDVDGLDVLNKIKEFDDSIKVIMLSTISDEAVVEKAKRFGADDFISKPFRLDYLEGILLNYIQQFEGRL